MMLKAANYEICYADGSTNIEVAFDIRVVKSDRLHIIQGSDRIVLSVQDVEALCNVLRAARDDLEKALPTPEQPAQEGL